MSLHLFLSGHLSEPPPWAGLTLGQVSSPRGKMATSIAALRVLWQRAPSPGTSSKTPEIHAGLSQVMYRLLNHAAWSEE